MAKRTTAVSRPGTMAVSRPSRVWLAFPLALAFALAAFRLLPTAQANPRLGLSILGASLSLAALCGVVWFMARGRGLKVEVQLRAQHYLQACAQGTVLAYWGWYWRPVYDAAPLIAAQLVFAYAFDMLLAWARRDTYTLGFAPFPVIFSTNLFLWFKPDWFFLQFLMIAVGFAAKDLIRWERDGRRVHIFNPSSFPLAVFSLGLILTGTTSITWGEEIATTQFNPPYIYLVLFLVGLPGQLLFGVTTMTMSAVLSTYLFGVAYYAATATYFFIDSYIPIAVFLGMHLLFTDPSTAPRTEVGRIVFGVTYGLANAALYAAFGALGVPKFYDKLLPVPLMNLSVRFIDRVAPRVLHAVDPSRVLTWLKGRRRHLAYVTVWAIVFASMSATEAVGDNHPGHRVPFWLSACQANSPGACSTLGGILAKYCDDGSAWACNERGVLRAAGRIPSAEQAESDFNRACSIGFQSGCDNLAGAQFGRTPRGATPLLADYPIILRTGKGQLPDRTPRELYRRACDQGWITGCHDLAGTYLTSKGAERDPARAKALLEDVCGRGIARGCSDLGYMHFSGDGTPKDTDKGLAYLKQSCDLGYRQACTWLKEQQAGPANE
jgi:hypothetical protein